MSVQSNSERVDCLGPRPGGAMAERPAGHAASSPWRAITAGVVVGLGLALSLGLAGCGGGGGGDGGNGGDGAGTGDGSDVPVTTTDPVIDAEWIAVNNRGVGLMGRYAYDEALAEFQRVVDAEPGLHDVRVNLAIATLNRQTSGDEERAIELLRAVRAEDPDNLRATYLLGLLELRRGEFEVAIDALAAVAAADPDDPYAAYFHGQAIESDDPETALAEYERSIARDPYLRSAWYRASGLLRRLGRIDDARARLDAYLELENNPQARMADFVYTEMGEKADASVIDLAGRAVAPAPPAPVTTPAGPTFAPPVAMVSGDGEGNGDGLAPAWSDAAGTPSVADLDGDGRLDVFIPSAIDDADAPNAVLLAAENGGWVPRVDHPLARVPGVRGALFGDVDDDGQVDAFLLRAGTDALWRRDAGGGWINATVDAGVGGPNTGTADGLLVDADHDGDLDIYLVRDDGTAELFSHDAEGSYRSLAAEVGFAPPAAGPSLGAPRVLVADLDARRDLDLLVVRGGGIDVRMNGRAWDYRPSPATESIGGDAGIVDAVPHDADADGRPELYAADASGRVRRWTLADGWSGSRPDGAGGDDALDSTPPRFAVIDVDGDGVSELLSVGADGPVTQPLPDGAASEPLATGGGAWTIMIEEASRGPSVVAFRAGEGPVIHRPGDGRHRFVAVDFRGRTDVGNSLRSNAAGIGTAWAARSGERWTAGRRLRPRTGPGQDLQPEIIGLAGRPALDFIAIIWPDGVLQTEVHDVRDPGGEPVSLAAGDVLEIAETQRQLSSCPVIFAWNGTNWAFISDVLGVGGVGYLIEPGVYAPPRPFERFLMPPAALRPRPHAASGGDVLSVKLHEPMEEVCYLDGVGLAAWDLPVGWDVVPDERLDVSGPAATSAMLAYRRDSVRRVARASTGAIDSAGADDRTALAALATTDGRAVQTPEADARFIGRFVEPFVLEVAFDRSLVGDDVATDGSVPTLILDGWVEYPYSQTNFAAWQGGVAYEAMSIDARAPGGAWTTVLDGFGYPAGMPRRMSVPLAGLPAGATELRLRATVEVYVDHLFVADVIRLETAASGRAGAAAAGDVGPALDHALAPIGLTRFPLPGGGEAWRHGLQLVDAQLLRTGFPARTTAPPRRPIYEYGERVPFADMRPAAGRYTALGDVGRIVGAIDDASAVFGPGEEVEANFAVPPAPASGTHRRFVLTTAGWCKDMDLFTLDGETVEPLPIRASSASSSSVAESGVGGAGRQPGLNPAVAPDVAEARDLAERRRTRLRAGRG